MMNNKVLCSVMIIFFIFTFLFSNFVLAEDGEAGQSHVSVYDADGYYDDLEYMIDEINDTLKYYPEIRQAIDGLEVIKSDGLEYTEFNGFRLEELDDLALKQLYFNVTGWVRQKQLETLRLVEIQQRHIREMQAVQRTLDAVRSASQAQQSAPAAHVPRHPASPSRQTHSSPPQQPPQPPRR